ncbi:MAG: CPBP family intramembrane metalloprotease [Proteobacteria bacterium]|nr:CPBP family intramembrane metalloprotease [Pseudomonadota bacterium]
MVLPSATELAWIGALTSLALAAIAFVGAALSRRGIANALGLGPSRLSGGQLVWIVLGGLGCSHALDSALALTGLGELGALAALDSVLRQARPSELAWLLLGLALGPGIAEELLFRGWLQRALLLYRRWPPLLAVATSAAAFGIMHVDPIHAGAAAVLGFYLGVVAWRAESVWPSLLCHVVNNALAVLTAGGALPRDGIGLAVGVLPLAVGCWVLWKRPDPAGESV